MAKKKLYCRSVIDSRFVTKAYSDKFPKITIQKTVKKKLKQVTRENAT